MSVSELKQEIAVMLFEKRKLTPGQASKLADMSPNPPSSKNQVVDLERVDYLFR